MAEKKKAKIDPEIIQDRYTLLKTYRDAYLTRSYNYAKVTLPYIISEQDDNSSSEVQLDYNSVGAEYVNHLANRYMQELFPAARSFFKLKMEDDSVVEQEKVDGTNKAEQEALLVAGEREGRWMFESRHARTSILDGLKHAIVTGNACLFWPPKKEDRVQTYALDEYVLMRSMDGTLLELITEDRKAVLSLPSDIKQQVIADMDLADDEDLTTATASLYTYIKMDEDDPTKYNVAQAIEGVPVPDSEQTYPADLLPWMPMVWSRTRREIYGRGLVEDHYGAFYAMSILTEAIVTGGAIMTDFKFLVQPGSLVDIVEMNSAASGTYHYGEKDDINVVETGKVNDFKFIFELINWYKQTLGKAFLSLSSQMRDAERVTAEENRLRAQELETAHGGVFSNFSLTLQNPIANMLLRDIDIDLKDSNIDVHVVTGLDAMGRTADNEKMLMLFNDLAYLQKVPEPLLARFKPAETITLMANGRDVEEKNFIMDDAAFNQQQAENAKAIAAQNAVTEITKKSDPEQIAAGLQDQVNEEGG